MIKKTNAKYIFIGIAKIKNIIFQLIMPYCSITCIYLHIQKKFFTTLVKNLFKVHANVNTKKNGP